MDKHLQAVILDAVQRTPQWVRRDLGRKDIGLRARAEESLAAIIANALQNDNALVEFVGRTC